MAKYWAIQLSLNKYVYINSLLEFQNLHAQWMQTGTVSN